MILLKRFNGEEHLTGRFAGHPIHHRRMPGQNSYLQHRVYQRNDHIVSMDAEAENSDQS